MRQWLRLVFVTALLGGCASLTEPPPLAPDALASDSTDLTTSRRTPLWAALVPDPDGPVPLSGIALLEGGAEAYRARLALIDAATTSIDVQSYIWKFDQSGQAITEALLRAADRGVRVRVLIDGFRVDEHTTLLKEIVRHPNLDVRLYNAFRTSFRTDVVRYSELVADFQRLNQRMHDKVLAADGAAAILGGRNVSDEYFGLSPVRYFYDRDVLVAGSLVGDVSASFDRFWNSPYAVPVRYFTEIPEPETGVLEGSAEANMVAGFPLSRRLGADALAAELALLREQLVWSVARLVRSAPGPVFAAQAPPADEAFEALFLRHIEQATEEIVLQTPYLTLTPAQRAALLAARRRGVAVTVHTNSLASTDWPIVQHGYVQERRKLLHWGVTLYELKDQPATCCRDTDLDVVPAKTVLHQKTIVVDRMHVFVGSFNIDNRSIRHNSEVGVLIDSRVFGARVLSEIGKAMQPENSWRLAWDASQGLVWLDETSEPPQRYRDDPHTGLLDQLVPWFGYFLPIDDLL